MAQNGKDQSTGATTRVVERNIEALLEHRRACEASLSWQDHLAGQIAGFAGNIIFVWLHVAAYGGWILLNLGVVPGIVPLDPTFVILAMAASVEALFLSTFILITQIACSLTRTGAPISICRSACLPSMKSLA